MFVGGNLFPITNKLRNGTANAARTENRRYGDVRPDLSNEQDKAKMKKFKYLVSNDHDRLWGLTVNTVGYEEIGPSEAYPASGHADGYSFDVSKGRVLNEFQLQYIKEGEGVFESHCQKQVKVKSGDIFLLFPGEWHCYHPKKGVGWKTYWIGFQGRNIDDRLRAGFLSPTKPIYHIGYSSEIVRTFENAINVAEEEKIFCQQILAGMVNYLIGMMYSYERNAELQKNMTQSCIIDRARLMIRDNIENNLSIQDISERLGSSYSNFRRLFKKYTGMSPAAYQQDLKLQRAKDLLSTTNMSIKEIAYRLNFDSPDYFSSKFRQKTGVKPSEFRQETT